MRVRLAGTAALLGAAVLVFGLTQAGAAPPPDPQTQKEQVDGQVRAIQADLDSSSRKLVLADAAYRAVQAKLSAAQTAVARAKENLAAARLRDAAMQERLARAAAAERRAERDLRQVATDIAQDRKTTGQMARVAYQEGPFAQLEMVMEAQSPTDFAQRVAMIESVLRSQNAALGRLRDVQAETRRREARLQERRARTAAERRLAAVALAKTRELARQAEAAEDQVEELRDQRRDAVAAIQRERAADLAQYTRLRAEQARLVELIRRSEQTAGSGPVISPGATLSPPVKGEVTSGFGMRYHPILQTYKLHTGTDFGVPSGTTVRAAAAGKVIASEFNEAYGNRVIVSHGTVDGKSLTTTYNHLSQRAVGVDDPVDSGQPVGDSGSTGFSTGPHLHFEVLVDGDFQDPMRWL